RRPLGTDSRQYALDCARYIETTLFRGSLPPEEVAAIFIEPIQGEGGYRAAPAEFLHELRALCNRHGILLVADEVQSGVARTGKWWAIQHSGVEPDIVCIAKGIASGMPLGITATRAEIMDWVPGSHASTFGGNPVCIAAALATLDVLEQEGLRNAEQIGNHILNRIRSWPEKHRLVGDVRGHGLMIGIDLVADKGTKAPSGEARDRVVELAFHRGCLFLGAGPSTIRICPPLILTREQADFGLDVLEACLELAANEPKPGQT
ncbi:MAG: aspartate aminotransferase family protein, partial [Candidatus Korobacteraceae bacterium]